MLNLSFLQNFRNFFCKCWRIFVWLSFFAWMMTHWIIVKKNCFVGILKLSKISKNLVVYTIKALKLLQVLLYIVQGSIQSPKQVYLIIGIRCSRCPDSNPWPKDYGYNTLSTAYLKKIEPRIFFLRDRSPFVWINLCRRCRRRKKRPQEVNEVKELTRKPRDGHTLWTRFYIASHFLTISLSHTHTHTHKLFLSVQQALTSIQ